MLLIRKLNVLISVLFIWMLLYSVSARAQCTGCTTVITGGSSNFTVNPGQVVCIGSGVTYTGNITINGGVLCNQGNLTRIVFKSGTFNNYGTFKPASLAISNNGNVLINCYSGSTFSISAGLSLTSVNASDSVVIYNKPGSLFSTRTGVSMHNTKLSVYNGNNSPGSNATFNVGAGFAITDSTDFKLKNDSNGIFNVSSNLSFSAAGNKLIVNKGVFNVNNAVSMSGTGNVSESISIINNGDFNVTGNITTAINNTGVSIINNSGGVLSTGISLTLSKTTNTLVNNGNLIVAQDLIIQNGEATNSGSITTTRDLKVNNGFYTNTNFSRAGRHFIVQTNGTVINNGRAEAVGYFQVTTSSFTNSANALIIATASVVIQTTATATNSGTITTSGDFKTVSSSLTNSNIGVINAGGDCVIQTSSLANNNGTITTVGDLTITNSLFNNTKLINVSNDYVITGTSLVTNDGTVTVNNNTKITTGTLTNNNYLATSSNFTVTNSTAKVNNNGFIEVGNEFKNVGFINLGQNSLIYTTDYINSGGTATITAPTSVPDTCSYPKIIISGASNNSGYLNGKLTIFDKSLVSTTTNVNYGFDIVTSSTRIASTILYGAKAVTPTGSTSVKNCSVLHCLYAENVNAVNVLNTYTFSAQLYEVKTFSTGLTFTTAPVSSATYTWLPVNVTGSPIVVTPTVSQVYTVTSNYLTCNFTNTVAATYVPLTVSTQVDHIKPDGVDTQGNIFLTVTGGNPTYTYTWMPGSIHTKDLTNAIAGTYSVTIKDAVGATLNYVYSLGYKTRWKNTYGGPVINDTIISAEVVSKNTLKPHTNGWAELIINSTSNDFKFGFSDSLSKNNDTYNVMDFSCWYLGSGHLYAYTSLSGLTTAVGFPVAGDAVRIERINTDFKLSINGNVVYTFPADTTKYYKLHVMNYTGPMTNVGSSFADSTNFYVPNYVKTSVFIKHNSSLATTDGSVKAFSKNNQIGDSYTWLPSYVVTNTLTNLPAGVQHFIASDTNHCTSNYVANVLYRTNWTDLQGNIFRHDSLLAYLSAPPSGYCTAVNQTPLKAGVDGEVSWQVQNSYSSFQIIGFADTLSTVFGDYNDIDYGVWQYKISSDFYYLYYFHNGYYSLQAGAHLNDVIRIQRVGTTLNFYGDDGLFTTFTATNTSVDWRLKAAIATGGFVSDVGASFTPIPISFTNTVNYTTLNKVIDAGYTNAFGNKIYFRFEEEYNAPSGSVLNYAVVNDLNVPIGSLPSQVNKIGDNRYSLDLSALGLSPGNFYKLKVTNNKNEVWYARFKY